MKNFLYKIAQFMQGRYGTDQLNNSLLVLWLVLAFINMFARLWVISIIELILVALYFYRALSKNIYKRGYENRKFLPVYNAVTNFFILQYKKIKDFKTHRYVKCSYCKAQLRVPNKKGKHTVRCPKCKQ